MHLLLLIATAQAGPWVRAPGASYTRLGYDTFSAASGTVDGTSTGLAYASHSANVYTEWGLPLKLQLVGSLPLVAASQTSLSGTVWHHNWTGDLRLELDRGLIENGALTVGAELRVPTYKDPGEFDYAEGMPSELIAAYATSFPELGDDNIDLTLKVMSGLGFDSGWLSAELGPRLRFGGYAHGAFASLSGGWWAVEDRAALGFYSALALRSPWSEAELNTRQELSALAQVLIAAPERAPGFMLELRAGGVPWAQAASRGWTAGAGVSWTRSPS